MPPVPEVPPRYAKGDILKGQLLGLAALDIDLLGGRLLDGVSRRGLQLSHLIPAVLDGVDGELAVFVRVEDPQVVQLAGGGVVGGIPDLELCPLNGSAGDAVHLVDSEIRLFVVLKINRAVPVGVKRHQLVRGILQVGRRHRFLRDLIDTRQKVLQFSFAGGVRPDLIHAVAVGRRYQENGVGHRRTGIRVVFVDGEIGTLLVLNDQRGAFAGE